VHQSAGPVDRRCSDRAQRDWASRRHDCEGRSADTPDTTTPCADCSPLSVGTLFRIAQGPCRLRFSGAWRARFVVRALTNIGWRRERAHRSPANCMALLLLAAGRILRRGRDRRGQRLRTWCYTEDTACRPLHNPHDPRAAWDGPRTPSARRDRRDSAPDPASTRQPSADSTSGPDRRDRATRGSDGGIDAEGRRSR